MAEKDWPPESTSDAARPAGDQSNVDEIFLGARKVRRRYGDISDMTLWRWCHDEDLAFPKPITIKGRRFWRWSNLKTWEKQRAAKLTME
jgi:predicted DNA-binding transcriptional regulator AlpA